MAQQAIQTMEHAVASTDMESADEMWHAIVSRDATADGAFFFAVTTTGIYCRPSCGARQPKRENVLIFKSSIDAEAAGYRPCKRCKPTETPGWAERNTLVTKACRYIEQAETTPALAEIAAYVGLSPHHFQRIFKTVTGITPKAYGTRHRTQHVKARLRSTNTVTEAIYDAGYSTSSRFYENAQSFLGMTAKAFRAGGRGQTIGYVIRPCVFGMMLLAATKKGVCSIQLGENSTELSARLKADFPDAALAKDDPVIEGWVDAAIALIAGEQSQNQALPLDIQGTAFQQQVWAALQKIPMGTQISYTELAAQIERPKAVRAVASACARNPVAVAIPCHRVIGKNGALSGYRWGIERKRALLAREKAMVLEREKARRQSTEQ